jgi:hypothetical protein
VPAGRFSPCLSLVSSFSLCFCSEVCVVRVASLCASVNLNRKFEPRCQILYLVSLPMSSLVGHVFAVKKGRLALNFQHDRSFSEDMPSILSVSLSISFTFVSPFSLSLSVSSRVDLALSLYLCLCLSCLSQFSFRGFWPCLSLYLSTIYLLSSRILFVGVRH